MEKCILNFEFQTKKAFSANETFLKPKAKRNANPGKKSTRNKKERKKIVRYERMPGGEFRYVFIPSEF